MPILALDFDGVLCDSVEETGTSGWKAGGAIWRDMAANRPPPALLDGFRRARPAIETGYQAIVLMRLLRDGVAPDRLLADFDAREAAVVARAGCDVAALKALFSATRDRWLAAEPAAWAALSPLYPGVAEWLRMQAADSDCYIVTTKERRFVERLLSGAGVEFPSRRIFGLDYGRPKEAVLAELLERHPRGTVCFVEDRLATLIRCRAQPGLERVAMRLAGWGYNTVAERGAAEHLSIPVWELTDLFRSFDQESQP
ncbi:HAD family hydrolase [Thiococcus pfennigii]|uniref:HAD family hydrolase n=1 Tax=Thiococcus pfennigii TaxID=1057 RepID=UPI001907E0FD|nr:HAD family hydrolase [Thiococcus pfennigii]MBK1700009.1 hypothetical protein [Thiococcus pfennigii]